MGQQALRVLIADDHSIVRQGIRQVLEMEPDIEVIGEAGDGVAAVEQALQLKPNLVLMDINMPRQNGVQAARAIKQRDPGIAILILTIHDDAEYLLEAAGAGVEGYVLKDVATAELVQAVRTTGFGGRYLHPGMGGMLLGALRARPSGAVAAFDENAYALTRRELDVLQLMAKGYTNGQIAKELFISEKTVKNHISHILEKLEVTDRLQAVLAGVKAGLVTINK